jgi:hypothetical protein
VRVRTSAELAIGATQRESMTGAPGMSDAGTQGFTLGAALAYGF